MAAKLNLQQKQFCIEWTIDFNATKAAERAKYSKKTAYSQGQRLLKHVEVQAEIRRIMKKRAEKVEITAENVLKGIYDIAFEPGGKRTDQLKALELLGKYLALFTERQLVDMIADVSYTFGTANHVKAEPKDGKPKNRIEGLT